MLIHKKDLQEELVASLSLSVSNYSKYHMKQEELIKKILKKIKTGRIDSKNIINENMKLDFSASIRHEYIDDGKILLVHDVPIAKEMVQLYQDGYHYKTAEAIDNIFVEFSPIALDHPDNHFRSMDEEKQKELTIGYMNDGYTKDNKKYCDLFFFVDKTPEGIINKIEGQQSMDVSIGFYHEIDETPGEFEGKHYDKKQTKIDLDHLAILLNGVGRASFPEGIGIGADNTNNEVKGTMEDKALEILQAREKELGDKLDEAKDTLVKKVDEIKAKDKEIGELKDELKKENVTDLKEKAEKLDKLEAAQKLKDEATVKDLKEEILKHKSARADDKFKEHIESKDNVEDLQFILDDLNSSTKGLPAAKKKVTDTDDGLDPADKYQTEKYKKVNEQEAV